MAELTRLNYRALTLTHLKRRIMTVSNIMYLMANIMKKHIGRDNAITGDNLFVKVYNRERKPDYVDDFRWDYVRKAMHRLRQSSKLFIVFEKGETGQYLFYVPTSETETDGYRELLENNMKRMRSMQQKAVKSVREKWYKLDWIKEDKLLSAYQDMLDKKQIEVKKR